MTGLALGAALGGATAGVLWVLGSRVLPLWAGVPPLLGAGVGAVVAWKRRWSDTDVALFLDARLNGDEAITSAIALGDETSARAAAVRERARALLDAADAKQARPRLLAPVHAWCVAGVASIAVFSLLPSRPTAQAETKPKGVALVRKNDVPGLDRVEALERAEGLSSADTERLKQLAREAKKLRADLEQGLPQREALSRIGRLRDDIASERQRFGDKNERPGLEAAANALSANEATRRAARALERGDVVAFDEEMERLANQAEAEARERAREALAEARDRARARGAQRLSEFLERQRNLFAEREATARMLQELARRLDGQLDDAGRQALRDFESGDLKALEQLAEALADALDKLTEEERKRLVEELAKRLEPGTDGGAAMDPRQLAELAKRLASPEGREALQRALRELAKRRSRDVDRERALGDAERGAAQAERGLMPIPLPGGGTAQPGAPPTKTPSPGDGSAPAPGGGRGDHEGAPEPSASSAPAEEFRSKADTKLLPGASLGTSSLGRAPARPGETANRLGTGELGSVGPQEVSAVENSDVPEEYREQVGRYFQP